MDKETPTHKRQPNCTYQCNEWGEPTATYRWTSWVGKKEEKKKVEVQDLRENNHSLYMNISNIPWISKEIPKDHNL